MQAYLLDLSEHIHVVRLLLISKTADDEAVAREAIASVPVHEKRCKRIEQAHPHCPINHLRSRLGLTDFEENCLWLAIACALDKDVADIVSLAQHNERKRLPTPWLCATLFTSSRDEQLKSLSLLSDDGVLFASGALIHESIGATYEPLWRQFSASPFLLFYMLGEERVDGRIANVARLVRPSKTLEQVALSPGDFLELRSVASRLAQANLPTLKSAFAQNGSQGFGLLLSGEPGVGKTTAVRAIASECGANLLEVDGHSLSSMPFDEACFALKVAFSQAIVTGAWLLIDHCDSILADPPLDHPFGEHQTLAGLIMKELDRCPVIVWLTCENPERISRALRERLVFRYFLKRPDKNVSKFIWQFNMPQEVELDIDVNFQILSSLPLSGRGVQNAIRLATITNGSGTVGHKSLYESALKQFVPDLSLVARQQWVRRSRDDLILPDSVSRIIDEVIETERVREQVLGGWGMQGRIEKGLGIVCLFDGDPGTGKTLAAEVIASELGVPLFTVSVANVVSKWIGETEKNLQKVFDEARKGKCVLLFDEADALFAKRAEVVRATDRYANMEVSLLLQLVENYSGVVILTTNLKDALDPALMRRITYKVNFPFPDAQTRCAIWKRLLPAERLGKDVDLMEVAKKFELSGGSIRTCALRACYKAARTSGVITSEILKEVCEHEYKALGRLFREG